MTFGGMRFNRCWPFAKRVSGAACAHPVPASAILGFVTACAIARLFAAWATGFTGDESYTIVISRVLALSYFDHPPLHQWVVHGFSALFGEGWWLRVPFDLMVVGINAPLYGLTRLLFGKDAAVWALFGFNATGYFVVWPDGHIMPDVPLFLFLTIAIWAVVEILFGSPRSTSGYTLLWLAAGVAFGLAGLSKYSALFAAASLFGFVAFSPRHRRWLWRFQTYLGALFAFAIFSPALIWNYQNGWPSFAFQLGRAATRLSFGDALTHTAQALSAQIALVSPWIGVPLTLALADAVRSRNTGGAERFLLWLIAVPLVFFAAIPFLGRTAIPHWYNSAWLFAFPLLGQKLSIMSPAWVRNWARISVAFAAVTLLLYTAYVGAAPVWATSAAKAWVRDPTIWSFNWSGLQEPAAWNTAGTKPEFAVVNKWGVGGKAGLALGPSVPVCAFTSDPREFAFLCDTSVLFGKDALIVIPKEDTHNTLPAIVGYFERLGPTYEVGQGRRGDTERVVTVTRGYRLLRRYETPYGINSIQGKR